MEQASAELGSIEVLEYSPIPQKEFLRPVLETTVEDLTAPVEFSIYGQVTAVHQVLGDMRALGRGSILFVNGGSGARPHAAVAGTSIAFAGEGAFAAMLYDTLAAEKIHVEQLIIPGSIELGHPSNDPAILAGLLWDRHATRGTFRTYSEELPFRQLTAAAAPLQHLQRRKPPHD